MQPEAVLRTLSNLEVQDSLRNAQAQVAAARAEVAPSLPRCGRNCSICVRPKLAALPPPQKRELDLAILVPAVARWSNA